MTIKAKDLMFYGFKLKKKSQNDLLIIFTSYLRELQMMLALKDIINEEIRWMRSILANCKLQIAYNYDNNKFVNIGNVWSSAKTTNERRRIIYVYRVQTIK